MNKQHDDLSGRLEQAKREQPKLQQQLRDYRERRRRYDEQRGAAPAADGYKLRHDIGRGYRA